VPPGRPGTDSSACDFTVRDVDTPALQPFRARAVVVNDFVNRQVQVTTVPEGKRLIVENISWLGTNVAPAEVIFAALRTGEFGPIVHYLEINPPHRSASPTLTLQDGVQQGPVFFEHGEAVWVTVSKTNGDSATFELAVHGFLVDLP